MSTAHRIRPIVSDVETIVTRQLEVMVYAHADAEGVSQRYLGSAFVSLDQILPTTSGVSLPTLVDHFVINPALPHMPEIRVTAGASWGPATDSSQTQADAIASPERNIRDISDVTPFRDGLDAADNENDRIGSFVFTVDKAVQLPLICRTSEHSKRTTKPNAYVTWSLPGDPSVISTDVAPASTRPQWGHRHSIQLPESYDMTRKIVFKVWHKPASRPSSPGTTSIEDTLIGTASVDLHPLSLGFLEVCLL